MGVKKFFDTSMISLLSPEIVCQISCIINIGTYGEYALSDGSGHVLEINLLVVLGNGNIIIGELIFLRHPVTLPRNASSFSSMRSKIER